MKVTGRTYAAIFLISLAALMVEVALTLAVRQTFAWRSGTAFFIGLVLGQAKLRCLRVVTT